MNSLTVQALLKDLSTTFLDFDFEFHGHNDLVMATANHLLALTSRSSSVILTFYGLGGRAGNYAVLGLKYII